MLNNVEMVRNVFENFEGDPSMIQIQERVLGSDLARFAKDFILPLTKPGIYLRILDKTPIGRASQNWQTTPPKAFSVFFLSFP